MTKAKCEEMGIVVPEFCCYCKTRPAEILYCLSHTGHGYEGYCSKCAAHLALGMLRDVAALRVGEDRAQTEYVELLKKHGKYPPS